MNIMFDQSFAVEKQELPVSLRYENIIFVFEDIDAATPIVRNRMRRLRQRKLSGGSRRRANQTAPEATIPQVTSEGPSTPLGPLGPLSAVGCRLQ